MKHAGVGIPDINQWQNNDPVRRRNAGGVKVGLPLIITGGKKRHEEFQELVSPDKKIKRKEDPRTVTLDKQVDPALQKQMRQSRRDFAEKLRYWLPREFCPDCGEHDRPHEGGAINVVDWNEPRPDLDIRPGEIVLSTWCQRCQMSFRLGPGIAIAHDMEQATQGMADPEDSEYMKRLMVQNRMQKNIEDFIRCRRLTRPESIESNPEMLNAYRR